MILNVQNVFNVKKMSGINRVDSKTLIIILSLDPTCSMTLIFIVWYQTGLYKKYLSFLFQESFSVF